MREGGATAAGDVPQIINRCQMLSRQIKRRSGNRGKENVSVNASWTVEMTDVKSVSSLEVSEGKLIKKVSGRSCQNVTVIW